MGFADRIDAGRQLAAALTAYKGERPVVLALPRGGVPVAAEVAAALDGDLDLILVRKIGVPDQPELAMGAVVDGAAPLVVRNKDIIAMTGVSDAEFDAVQAKELAEIDRRRTLYLGQRHPVDLAGRIAIVVDDGIATGATMRAALQAIRQRRPRKLILAVPVAPPDTIERMRGEVDEVVCLERPMAFGAIGYYYQDFHQLEDRDVIDLLARHPVRPVADAKRHRA